MQACIKREAMGDDPPYLAVGTEVSAKYKGAFCEAKVRKVVRSVKCKVTFKLGLGTAIVTDDQIRGTLRSGSSVEAKHPEKKDFVEASITKIQDCSQYTVVFDDGDITTLRRSALCLKSGRHFAESETLDQLPLTHPEHFSNPVIGGSRRGRRSRQTHDDGSEDEEDSTARKGKKKEEKEVDIGKVVCVELGERKKQKDNWFPGLVVAPTAQDTVRIRVKDEYLVRSFKDGRYYTVPKKEATEFTREIGAKVDNNTLKAAVEKALQFLDRDELPPHWDRELLFRMDGSSGDSNSEAGSDSDSSDDEPREEKDHFVAQLYKFMDDRGTPINKGPTIGMKDVDLYKLFKVVHKIGGYNRVTNHNQWKMVSQKLGFGQNNTSNTNLVKQAYKKFLHSFEDFYRKLGCTMVNHPRGSRSRHRSSRSLIRDRDRATPINTPKRKEADDKEKSGAAASSKKTETKSEEAKPEEKEETVVAKVEEEKKESGKSSADKKEVEKKATEEKGKTGGAEEKGKGTGTSSEEKGKGSGASEETKPKPVAEKKGKQREQEKAAVTAPVVEEVEKVVSVRGSRGGGGEEGGKGKKEPKGKGKDDTPGKGRETGVKGRAKEDVGTKSRSSKAEEKTPKEDSKAKAKEEAEKKVVAEEPTPPVKVEPPESTGSKAGTPSTPSSSSKAESAKAEPVEPSTPVAEVRKGGRELGLRSQVKEVASLEIVPKDVKQAEKDKSRGVVDDAEDNEEEELKVDDDEGEEEDRDDEGEEESVGKKEGSGEAESRREERRREKRGDDEEKLTRSKSKESNPEVRRARESRTPIRESEMKKGPSKPGSVLGVVGSSSTKRPVSSSSSSASSGSGGSAEEERKRGRKRKDLEEKGSKSEEHMGQLSNHIHVGVGDKLKVYYGPTHESKVTYEAKVVDTEMDGHQTLYLVHYTGWNTRYDEWIKRSRIAENLSWNPTRAKRLRQQQQSQSMKPMGKRGRPSLSGGSSRTSVDSSGNGGGPPGSQHYQPMGAQTRSATPSGSSSQSPGVRGAGGMSGASPHPTTPTSSGNSFRGVTTRGNAGLNTSTEFSPVSSGNFSLEMRRRSRRMSGHTDVSMPSESESEEYESEPEPEVEPLRTRSRGERKTSITIMPSKAEEAVIAAVVDEKPSTKETKGGDRYLRKRGKRKKEKAEEEEEERKEVALEEGPEGVEGSSGTPHSSEGQEPERTSEVTAVEEPPPSSEKKRVKRTTRRSARDDSEKQEVSLPPETSQLEMEEDTPKGRDFDLNQIRSELKGIEKAVKLPIDLPPMQSDSGEPIDVTMESSAQEEMDSKESDVKEPPTLVSEASAPVVEEVTEDIYEFKEPEPFEFEVRSKRDTLIIEERGMKLGRRCNSRLMRREVKTSPSKVSEGSKESLGWSDNLPSFRPTSSRRAATAAAKKSEESPSNEEAAAKSLSPVRSETKPETEAPHVTPSKASSSSPSHVENSSTKMHHSSTPTGTEEDEAHSPLSTKHASLPEEDESSKKPVSSSTGSATKSRSSPFGLMSSSIPMFSPRKSPSLSSPSAISPPSMHSIDLEPLCLFGDLPSSADGDVGEDDDGGDESGDRLIISDKPGDAEPPLFTYPQRHEELFPASLVSSGGVGSSCDDAEDARKQSDDEPPCLIPMPIFDLPSKSSAEKGDKDNKSTAIERLEVVKVVVQEEEDGVETEAIVKKPQALKCSDSFSTDMINLLLKDDEEEEGEGEGDESISAAIQRVISSEIMDEDDDDEENLTLFGKKPTKEFFRRGGKDKECPPPTEKSEEGPAKVVQFTVAVEEECAQEEKQEKVEVPEEVRKSPELRDQVVSQGHSTPLRDESMSVVMRDDDSSTDTDSDSSEESRLVIDKLDEGGDDDESMQSSYNESERKPKEETVVIVDSAKVDCVKQCSLKMFGVKESPKAEEEAAKEVECDEPHPGHIISSPKREIEEIMPKDKSEDVMLKVAVKEESMDWKESESDKEGECKVQTEMQIKAEEEAESSLRSLLCEETIPGSPVPAANDSRECCQDIPEKQSKVPEMPFASVPGNENSSSSSLLRSENVRNDGNICGGLSSSAQMLKGPLEPFACESNITPNAPPCRPSAAPCAAAADDEPSAPGSESTSTTAPKGKDAGGNDAAPVMDNTPPTTPESSLSTISGSPREERGGSSPGLDNDSSKSHRESSEIDLDSPVEGNKVDHFSEDLSVSDSLLNIDVSISEDNNQLMLLQGLKVSGPQKRSGVQDLEKDTPSHAAGSAGMQDSPSKKKRRTHRRSEDPMSQGAKRLRHSSGRGRNLGGSDSDDTSENSTSGGCTPLTSTENVVSSRSPRPSKYNFYVELDPELDGTQRIALLQQKLQELRKTYMSVKAELACIDRRRKKLRRREREEKAAKHEVACS